MRRRVSGGRAAGACGGKATGSLTPDISCGTGRCHPHFDPADAELHQSADLKQLETDGAAGGVGKVRLIQTDATQRAQEHIGHRGKPQAQLVSPHSGRGGSIGIEIELALLNPILHISAGTVHFLIEIARFALDAFERGDNEARIGFAVRPLGFGNNSALAAPALARPPLELLKTPCWLAGTLAFLLDGLELARDLGIEPIVLRQSQDKVYAVRFAPGHQRVASKAAVGAQQNANPWPLSANVGDNACHLLRPNRLPRPRSRAAVWRPADAVRRIYRAAGSSSSRNNRGKTVPPAPHAQDRPSHQDQEQSRSALARAHLGTSRLKAS